MDFGTDLLICRSKEAAQQVCMKQTDHENDEVGLQFSRPIFKIIR